MSANNNETTAVNTAQPASSGGVPIINQHTLALVGERVIIGGIGGSICIDPDDHKTVTTSWRRGTLFEVELIESNDGDGSYNGQQRFFVAFRVIGAQNKYLSVVLYGDEMRNATAKSLSHTPLLPCHIPDIVDYAVDQASGGTDFEGAGYNYQPMTAEDGPPGLLQMFSLEYQDNGSFGIKTRFNTYWRSQHWNKTVSQSPHCLADERWRITSQS